MTWWSTTQRKITTPKKEQENNPITNNFKYFDYILSHLIFLITFYFFFLQAIMACDSSMTVVSAHVAVARTTSNACFGNDLIFARVLKVGCHQLQSQGFQKYPSFTFLLRVVEEKDLLRIDPRECNRIAQPKRFVILTNKHLKMFIQFTAIFFIINKRLIRITVIIMYNNNLFIRKNEFGTIEKVDELKAWKIALKLREVTPKIKVCSLHFKKEDYILPGCSMETLTLNLRIVRIAPSAAILDLAAFFSTAHISRSNNPTAVPVSLDSSGFTL
ncbi:hypothetical protein NQ318_012555 [Aromia moschata]|uniref:THAP-type domain-containing protein n=1 Tax=Aromia moschata TaxID=1265417 RepID=A0AAV8XAQ2_9CUCU|nr:hypothetical protein NQ318_012555 [Aromia moschata]